MIKLLHDTLANWLEAQEMYGLIRIFSWPSFRAISAVIISFLLVVIFGKRVINWLIRQKIGDSPEFDHAGLNELMAKKANTPTMGGILIAGSILFTTLLMGDLGNFYVKLGLIVLVWLSVLGGVDDWLKLTNARRATGSRDGLYAWEKLLFQLGIGVLAGIFLYRHGAENALMAHSLPSLPFMRSFEPGTNNIDHVIELSAWVFAALSMIMITGSSNAVNLTDGMDGLAGGIAAICAFALMILCAIAGNETTAKSLLMPWIPYTEELSIVAGAMAGATLGFLWYNCSPASVFMGDTGSLALGGLMAYLAIAIRQEFMLLVIGGVFLMEMMSVILQVGFFKATKLTSRSKGGGKRIFRCAPIHHHFHLGGWTEQQVVVRFWLLTAVLSAIALASIRLR